MVELKNITDVHTLGVLLGLSPSKLAALQENNPRNNDQQKSDMLNTWLDNDPEKSWNKLVRVLVEMDKGAIAKKIAEKYCPDFIFPGESAVHVQYYFSTHQLVCQSLGKQRLL